MPAVDNSNSNVNYLYGSGTINNNNSIFNYVDMRLPVPPAPYKSDVGLSTTLPPKPVVFHGRDDFVDTAVQLLVAPVTARLAVLGSGGMGKTTVALAVLYDSQVTARFDGGRLFLSCEALVDADAIVVSLAKLLGLPASNDLLTTVVNRLAAIPRVLLVLDNLETVWLAGGAPVSAVDELLGQFAQIPSLSLIITCRGIVLPQFVEWSNSDTATLEPFSLEAALRTFEDRAGRRLAGEDVEVAKQLLNGVDRMPLAVSLLGQLARRGNSVSELLDRWNREHSALLRTHGAGRINNVEVSIQLSITMMAIADDSQESLQLLSLCSMLPDGLRPGVFDRLRPQFKHIDRARDNLTAYALASLGADRVLKTLSPIRHLVLARHITQLDHRDALHSIYFDIAQQLPIQLNPGQDCKELADAAALEMGNLSSLLLTLVHQPSGRVVNATRYFTYFSLLQQPTMTVASALLPHLEPYPEWKAECLLTIGNVEIFLGNFRSAVRFLIDAAALFLEIDDQESAAWCKHRAGEPLRNLCEYDQAEALLNEAGEVSDKLGNWFLWAACRQSLGLLMRQKEDYSTAIEHLSAAREAFNLLEITPNVYACSEVLGVLYMDLGMLDAAAGELEPARAMFTQLGHRHYLGQTLRHLSQVRCRQGNFTVAEQLLREAEVVFKEVGERFGLAECAHGFGELRMEQGIPEEAIAHFKSAHNLYLELELVGEAEKCAMMIEHLRRVFPGKKALVHLPQYCLQMAVYFPF